MLCWHQTAGVVLVMTIGLFLNGPHHAVEARSNGQNVDAACNEMIPFHGTAPQLSPPPYVVTFEPASYTPGIPVRVTISACDPVLKPFKGFMIQARRAVVRSDQTEILGSFTPVAGTQRTCSGKGLIHQSAAGKTSLTFEWNPPSSSQGHVQFWVTFVQAFKTFWAATKSEVMKDASVSLPAANTLSPETTRAGECGGNPVVPSGCGTNKGCISRCSSTSCGTVIVWEDNNDSVLYTITSKVPSSTSYVAIAFSSDQMMGADSVTGCASAADGTIVLFNAENTGRRSPVLFQDNQVQLTQASIDDNVLSCTFNRLKAASANGKRFDVTQKWNILFARGLATVNGQTVEGLNDHNDDKFFTAQKYSSNDAPVRDLGPWPSDVVPSPNPNPVDPSTRTAELEVPPECGTSIGCVSQCSGSKCETVISWQETGDSVLYTVSSAVSSAKSFVAIGLSSDAKMGGDSVIGCASASDGSIVVFTAQNTGQVPPAMFDDNSVTLKESSIVDNVLSCKIERPKAASTDGKLFDASKKWIILFAKGEATVSGQSVSVRYHGENKFLTSSKYSSSDTPNVGASELDYPLVKAHGSLMVAAWIFFASIGIVAARYYKPVWTDSLCDQKVWFQIHRTCMILVFCTTVAGFVVIFLEVEDWSELIEKDEYLEYHPIMGVIVTALTVINPLMALIRPHPGTKNRPLFNWAHWFVGTAAHVLAVITIFFGVQLQKAQAPDYMIYILAGYVAWQVLVDLLLEIMQCCGREKDHTLTDGRVIDYLLYEESPEMLLPLLDWDFSSHHRKGTGARQELYEMDDLNNQKVESKESDQTLKAKQVLLMLHFFVLTVVTAIIIGFISIGEKDLE